MIRTLCLSSENVTVLASNSCELRFTMLKETMQLQPKKIILIRFALLALFVLACVLYYSYSSIQKKPSHSVILRKSCLKKKVSDISTFLKDRSENFNLQHEDCNIISKTMDQIFDLGKKCVLFSGLSSSQIVSPESKLERIYNPIRAMYNFAMGTILGKGFPQAQVL